MKKILLIIIGITFLNIFTLNIAHAECNPKCKNDEVCIDNTCKKLAEALLPIIKDKDTGEGPENTLGNLPQVSSENVFKTAIKTILGASMLLTIIAIVIAAVYYIQSQGQEEDISKAKNIILYLIIGMAIMAAAYGIVSGVIQFKFFDAVS